VTAGTGRQRLQHARRRSVYAPEEVAETVDGLVRHPRAEVVVGGFGTLASLLKPLTGPLGIRLTGRALN
jgi:hypothetical protein